jgi:serine protease Do
MSWTRPLWAGILLLLLVSVVPPVSRASNEPEPIAAMVAKVSPAVVRVITVRPMPPTNTAPGVKVANELSEGRTSTASGSGFIIDPSGYIGTNKHVVDGAISVFVVTAEGIRYPAQIVGMGYNFDMALLRINAGPKPLPYVRFGDSDQMRVGNRVFAIGSPFGFDSTVTSGIVSAVNRDITESPFDDYMQTDAAINHGNSGGPLLNMAGEVIGMTSVIFSPDPGSSGVGFAVPSNGIRFVFGHLMKTGKVNAGMLPIHTQQVTWMLQQALGVPDLRGALVTSVQDDQNAMLNRKIRAGDVIRAFNGAKILDPRDLARQAAHTEPGTDVVLDLYRGGVSETVHVTLQAWPEAQPVVLNDDGPRTLGLELAAVQGGDGKSNVTVVSVDPTGTAADSGIQKGDIIVEIQQTPVSDPVSALLMFGARSSLNRHFAAVLVRHDKKLSWLSLAVPE